MTIQNRNDGGLAAKCVCIAIFPNINPDVTEMFESRKNTTGKRRQQQKGRLTPPAQDQRVLAQEGGDLPAAHRLLVVVVAA